jgi:hypothetical protein
MKDAGSRKDFSQAAAIAQSSRKDDKKATKLRLVYERWDDERNSIDHSDYFADRGLADLAV